MKHQTLKINSKRLSHLLIIAVLISFTPSCFVIRLMNEKKAREKRMFNPNQYMARAVMNNSSVKEGKIASIRTSDQIIRFINSKPGVDDTEIESGNIQYIEIWSDKKPDKKYKLIYTPVLIKRMMSSKLVESKDSVWLYPMQVSAKLSAYALVGEFDFDENGDIVMHHQKIVETYNDGNGYYTYTKHVYDFYILKPAMYKLPAFVVRVINSAPLNEKEKINKLVRNRFYKRIKPYIEDDPELYKYMVDSKLHVNDLPEIVKRYNPKK